MTDREKLDKIKRILDKYKENYIICFDKPLWEVVKKILKLCEKEVDHEDI